MRWTLLRESPVELAIVDVSGRRVRHLVSGVFSAGTHEFAWDGRDDDGRTLRAGAYFMAGTIDGERTSQRLFLLH
jgi:flagellar hook assembly protein FlgD